MRVALCQMNATVGDLQGNATRMLSWYEMAAAAGARLVVFPELALCGYPPRDLLDVPDFQRALDRRLASVVERTGAAGLLFGTPLPNPAPSGKRLRNGAVLAAGGHVQARVGKRLLPLYDVFDEARHFEAEAGGAQPVEFLGIRWGIHICEDAWNEDRFWPGRRLYARDPVAELAEAGAEILLNLSSSPFHARKGGLRRSMFESHCRRHRLPLLYTNQVGGNDELVFDGEAFVFDDRGSLLASGHPFEEEILYVDVLPGRPARVRPEHSWSPLRKELLPAAVRERLADVDSIERALVLGLSDYAAKSGFRSAVLGLSGGIDSAVTAVLAARALGPANVLGVALPGPFSGGESRTDAEAVARNLGLRFDVISIDPLYSAARASLKPVFDDLPFDATEENLQARARAMILMALSNKFGHLVLSTGNKSEIAVGFCTLYGDMVGGLAVISDVPKSTVYELAHHMNLGGEVIPARTISRPPSAELRPDQKDEDSLPPYALLDRVIEGYIEDGAGIEDLVSRGLPRDVVESTVRRIWKAEYKRRQAAPGIKISPRAFGSGRRMPIAGGWPDGD
jgi:NAD+ synthetase